MEITFIDGTVKEVDINVTSMTLFKLQKEKVIDGDFLKGFMKKEADLDPVSIMQGVYAAYRQANKKDYLKFDDFFENYLFDFETDGEIYFAVISKRAKKKFQEKFNAAAGTGKK